MQRLGVWLGAATLTAFALMPGAAARAQVFGLLQGTASTPVTIYSVSFPGNVAVATLAHTTNVNGFANGLAFDGVTGNLYFRTGSATNTANLGLYYWNRLTNSGAQLTGVALPNVSASNAAFYNNAYWFVGQGSDTLYRANLNAAGTSVTSIDTYADFDGTATSSFAFGDIAINSGGVLYGSTSTSGLGLFRVNVGGASPSGFSVVNGGTAVSQLALDPSGTLYGHSAGSGSWYTVDPGTGGTTPYSGTTFLFGDIASTSSVAPEPGAGALTLLGALVFGGVARRARRRQSA